MQKYYICFNYHKLYNAIMDYSHRDQKHLWHPLTQHKTAGLHLPIVKAKGALLYDHQGKTYIDAIASWYTVMYGHCNEYLINFVTERMRTLDQVVFTGFTHPPAIEMSERLMAILPMGQQKIFFSENGSTAVDVALKIAFQYHSNQGKKRTKIIAFDDAFHGDTFGAMSVSGLSVYNGAFEHFFIEVIRLPLPTAKNIETLSKTFEDHCKTQSVAAFVFEPLVQGAAGMRFYLAQYLDILIKIAKKYEVLCIADEVMTGFGKTGTYFASDQLREKPDMMCLSKALTAGIVPMGLTTCTQKIYDAFYDDSIQKGFFHGHTYSANPLACNAVIAGIDLLTDEKIQQKAKQIEQAHQKFAEKIKRYDTVKNVRVKGVIFAFELHMPMERYGKVRNKIFDFFMGEGVFIRPLGETIYLLPPFIITSEQLQKVYDTLSIIITTDRIYLKKL